ncbi:MAG TPA: Ldh family oxidoreductase [Verrucomicrobiota bacterium]|nr:Ldh family oxidoreductase [Verrucomicrobiota bacterium]HQL77463.1 Ldh family oxidoreductase [Verrucomicrobiota bacterium]
MNTDKSPAPQTASAVSYEKLHRFAVEAFTRAGVSAADAAVTADVLATTDAWGIFTHGTKNIRGYLRRLKAGGLRAAGRPRLAAEGPAWGIVDGDSALGMVTSVFAMRAAIAKARACGIAYVGVRKSCHFGAAGYYAWLAAREGLIGLSMANDIPSVAAPGSRGAITGSNPISYSVPAGRHSPLLLDMSTATVAGGKVYAARTRGERIPDTWLIGADGRPTTDPSGYPAVGALQPAAGHKGYGIALLIETLSGILSGAAATWRVGNWLWDDGTQPTNHGAAFLAIDTNTLMPAAVFARRMEALVGEIHAAPRADGIERLYVPGEMEWERHGRAMREGIQLPPDVVASLHEAAKMAGMNPADLFGRP